MSESEKTAYTASGRTPSRPWVGALLSSLTFLGAAWLLAYTLFDLPPVEALGPWNYVGVVGIVVVDALLGKLWRGADYVRPTNTSRV
ncbi:cell division protein CrgA [Cryptosporangium phraense]|uniref:cell division protein CrgA n=1 Tax=Cryptosporangium phraense TaxID=2593070 RepID=UPI0014789A39|nr:cell division protein CrgA [Cryptosporangium phraense]